MGGGGRPPGTRSRQPGALGIKPGSMLEQESRHEEHIFYLDERRFVLCTKIYFRTGDSDLRHDDRAALYKTAKTMRRLMVNGCTLELACRGHADVRADPKFNEDLSAKRVARVEAALRALLGHLKMWKMRKAAALGEAYARNSPALWAEDRRVDVWVRVEGEAEREARTNPWVKTRTEIFRRYSPVYHHWAKSGLDYLIEMYEQHDQESYPVTVRPGDMEKVYNLILVAGDPSERGLLRAWAKPPNRAEVITDFYCVEYRRAYAEALRRYEASPEYGSLSPKG
jgi:outer membrane protein OmpA-like peptidoglycan-associated protein